MSDQKEKSALSSHALVAFAFVEEAYAKTGDIVSGLLPLFAPLLIGKKGRPFDAKTFSEDVSKRYGIPMSQLVAEGLVARFAQAELLYLEDPESRIYRVSSVQQPVAAITEDSIDKVLNEFVEFANDSLRPLGLEQSAEVLKTGLLARLTSAQFLSAVERKERNYFIGNKLTLKKNEEPEDAIELKSAMDVLSAEFALRAMKGGGASADLLVKIATGALIAEVVLTLQSPSGIDSLEGLSVFIDAPLLLDKLDLSSVELRDFATSLFDLMAKANVRMAVFSHTLEEMRGTILGPLDALKRGEEPFGPLGSRIRMDSSHAAYARSVLDSLAQVVESLGIIVLDADELRTEGGIERLSAETEESLRNNVGPLHVGLERRIRDAASVAAIMRLRLSDKAHSIAEAGSLLVTRNSSVASLSKAHLVFKKIISKDDVAPAVTDRTLAGYLWFVVGGNVGDITRQKLIANCTYVMTPKNDIIGKVRQYLTEMDREKAEVFSALLLDNRAQRCLVHATLGFPAAVTSSNVDVILKEVRESVASDLVEESRKRESELAEAHRTQLSEMMETQKADSIKYESELLLERSRANSLIDDHDRVSREEKRKLDEVAAQLLSKESQSRADVDSRMEMALAAAKLGKQVAAFAMGIVYLALVWLTYDLSPDERVLKLGAALLVALLGYWVVPALAFKFLGKVIWRWQFKRATERLALVRYLDEFVVNQEAGTVVRKQ